MTNEYLKTGVEGLDSILGGGISEGSTVLVNGNPGTGKSILSLQYLYSGVEEHDQGGVYLNFEENIDDISEVANSLGFDRWDEFVESGEIEVYDKRDLLEEQEFSSSLNRILEELDTEEYSRLVMDSLTMFEMFFESEDKKRTYLLKLIDLLKYNGFTSLLTRESKAIFPDRDIGLEEFLTDGNIYLVQTPTSSKANRYIWVAKMRKQDIDTHIFPMELGRGGIKVHENAAGFSYMNENESFDGDDAGFGGGGP
ncbi:MAG: ATPase domain-containing protein [Halobacteria archaeon]|nr:ATPase domain-containing protein [Halobacteria archaeon]